MSQYVVKPINGLKSFIFFLLTVTLLQLFSSFTIASGTNKSNANDATLPSQDSDSTILVVGDSLSAGYGLPLDKGWVSLLEKRLQENNYSFKVVNASISGDTSHGAKSRLPSLLNTHQPKVVVIEIGGNDGLRGQPVKTMKKNIQEMIEQSQKQGAKVVLLGIQIPFNFGPRYTQMFTETYQELASQFNLAFVPSFMKGVGDKPEFMQGDKIHPNVQGQPILLKNVWPTLDEVLRKL